MPHFEMRAVRLGTARLDTTKLLSLLAVPALIRLRHGTGYKLGLTFGEGWSSKPQSEHRSRIVIGDEVKLCCLIRVMNPLYVT